MSAATMTGQVGVVTGASGGIGRAIALELAARGSDLWLIARHQEPLEAAAEECREFAVKVWPVAFDVGQTDDPRCFREMVARLYDGVDILVHSAGHHTFGTVAEAPVADLDEQYRVNVRGPFVLTQALLPLLRARHGQIVFLNSTAGLQARARVGAYAATKHALRALADALREEVNDDGVRVLSVFPGRTATTQQAAIFAEEGRPYRPERLMKPEDVAGAVVHALCADRTAEVTEIRLRPMQKS